MARETYQNLRSARWFAREELCGRTDSDRADWVKRNMTSLYETRMPGTSYGACALHVAQTGKGCDFDFLTSETWHSVPELVMN